MPIHRTHAAAAAQTGNFNVAVKHQTLVASRSAYQPGIPEVWYLTATLKAHVYQGTRTCSIPLIWLVFDIRRWAPDLRRSTGGGAGAGARGRGRRRRRGAPPLTRGGGGDIFTGRWLQLNTTHGCEGDACGQATWWPPRMTWPPRMVRLSKWWVRPTFEYKRAELKGPLAPRIGSDASLGLDRF